MWCNVSPSLICDVVLTNLAQFEGLSGHWMRTSPSLLHVPAGEVAGIVRQHWCTYRATNVCPLPLRGSSSGSSGSSITTSGGSGGGGV
eukprot:12717118-Prorocentrum_lima.AAC.1